MKQLIGKLFFKLSGWKLDISVPTNEIKKCVLVAAPHTTNWDFVYANAAFWYKGIPLKFYIKDTWTKPWYGFIFRKMGGIGIDRSKSFNGVEFGAHLLKEADDLYLLNTPEGSRSWAEKWKTGFYYMAQKAEVPILLSYCDYPQKQAGIGKVIDPTQLSFEEAMAEIQDFYKDIKGKYPEKYNPKIY